MRYGYFPGCSLLSSAAEYDLSARAVLQAVGVELEEIDDWVCCGATPAHALNNLLSLALPAISCAAAEKRGLDIMTCCAACFSRLKQASHELRENEELCGQVCEVIEEDFSAEPAVFHLTEVLARQVGLEAVSDAVTRPLKGLRVACYYGCLLTRVPEELRIDRVEYPVILDRLVEAAGAEAVEWPAKTECCGASLTLPRGDIVVRLSGEVIETARDCRADVLAVACPLCQANLDMFQSDAEARLDRQLGVPVLYVTQLLALAMELEPSKVGLEKAIVDPRPVLAEKGLVKVATYL